MIFPAETVEPVVFPPAGEMLIGDCPEFSLPEDDGKREVTIEFIDLRPDGQSMQATYDLVNTPMAADGPTLTLCRENPLSSQINKGSDPISEKKDRDWVLNSLAEAAFESTEEMLWAWSIVLNVEDDSGKTEYYIDPDGTVCRRTPDGALAAAYRAVDYFGFSALAYKYADDARGIGGYYVDQWLTEAALENYEEPPADYVQWWESSYPMPPAAHYKLCLRGEDFHMDLDREQAVVMLRALFGESWTGGALMPSIYDFAAQELSYASEGKCIRLTEYLIPLGTPYEEYLREEESVIQQTFYLCSDGTLVRVPRSAPGYHHFEYGIETIKPSWQRCAVLENAFDPDVLRACLAGLEELK